MTDSLLSEYRPQVAIMVYESKENVVRDGKYYLESHDISDDGRVMAGKPLLQDTIQDIIEVFSDEHRERTIPNGFIPENLLYFKKVNPNDYKLIWWRPSEERVMHHSSTLKIKTEKAIVPPLVYLCSKSKLFIYALKGEKRPEESSVLFNAPFFNTADNGSVCLGNAKTKKPADHSFKNIIKYWEDLFWLSEFTHVNGSEKVKSGDLRKVWVSLVGKKKKFPITELLPTKATLKSIM